MQHDRELQERIGLCTHGLRHALEINHIVVHLRPQALEDALHQRQRIGHAAREVGREQRRVVVAEIGAEEGQHLAIGARNDGERHDEQRLAVRGAADNHRRAHAFAFADMALPGGEPFVGLEDRGVGGLLEGAPAMLDGCERIVNFKIDRFRSRRAARRRRRRMPRPSALADIPVEAIRRTSPAATEDINSLPYPNRQLPATETRDAPMKR